MNDCYYVILRNYDGDFMVFPKIELTLKAAVCAVLEDIEDDLSGLFDEDEISQILKDAEHDLLVDDDHIFIERSGNVDITYQIFEVGFKEDEEPDDFDLPYDEWLEMVIARQVFSLKPVNGLYPGEFAHGFYEGAGEDYREGYCVLKEMGLPITPLPFNVEQLLSKGTVSFWDQNGNKATISYKINNEDDEIICTAQYLGKEKTESIDADYEEVKSKKAKALYRSISIGLGCAMALFATLPQ